MEDAHFLRDVITVSGDIVGDGDELGEEAPGCDAKEAGKDKNYGHGGYGARKTKAFEQGDDGGQKESKEDGESKGEEKDFTKIKNSDGQNRDGNEPELRE